MRKSKNYVGHKFNLLTALSEHPREERKHPTDRYFIWECECGNIVSRGLRDIKRGRTKSCGCHSQSDETKQKRLKTYIKNGHQYDLRDNYKRQEDPFLYLMKKVNTRLAGRYPKIVTIDVNYLKKLWQEQDGRCSLTNVPMILFVQSPNKNNHLNAIFQCSVDRIDNDLGYIPGNIRLTTWGANAAKNKYSDSDFSEWLVSVKNS